jgi:DNA-binding IclR family transcriptional regulator
VSGVQSVERALVLLHEIASEPCSSSELARRTGLATSTAARLLGTLTDHGTVVRDSAGRYRIGPSIVAMAASADPTHGLVELATRPLLDLANDTGESASLGIPLGNEMQYVAQMNTAHPVQIRDWVGTRAPVHGGAPGLVILASWSNDRIDEYLGRRLLPMTKSNVTDPSVIRQRIEHVRRDGFIWTHEEGADGISVVAAPVRNSVGTVIASLQAWGPSYRFPAKGRDRVVSAQVVAAAQRVSSMLGFRRRTENVRPT